jgi:transposase
LWYISDVDGKEMVILTWQNVGRRTMAWFRVELTEEQQRIVNEERASHPNLRVREKMLVLWLLHCGLTRQKAAEIVGVGRATVQRYVVAFREGGLDGLRQSDLKGPVSELAAFRELIRASFEKEPVRTIAEACERVSQLTGLRRGPSQVRKFLKDMGLKWQRVRAIPVPPKKTWPSRSKPKPRFTTPN